FVPVPSGKILRESQKQMKIDAELGLADGGKISQPKVAIQFSIGFAKCRLISIQQQNARSDKPDRYF
ncbi:hypothetical protein TNCV_2427641, partial [Trichonephila clavipes]